MDIVLSVDLRQTKQQHNQRKSQKTFINLPALNKPYQQCWHSTRCLLNENCRLPTHKKNQYQLGKRARHLLNRYPLEMLNAEIAHNMSDAGKCSSVLSNNLIELIRNGFSDKKCLKTAIFCCALLLM